MVRSSGGLMGLLEAGVTMSDVAERDMIFGGMQEMPASVRSRN